MNGRRTANSGMSWLGGCAIGCGVATVLLVIVLIIGIYGAQYGIEAGRKEVVEELKRQIGQEREAGRIPVEAGARFTESLALLEQTDATVMATFAVAQLFERYRQGDETMRAEVLAALGDLEEFLSSKPGAEMMALFEFVEKHPTLNRLLGDNLQFTFGEGEGEGEF